MDWSKTTYVGRYFESALHKIIGGELRLKGMGDIYLPRLKVPVEIKASGSRSSYGFRLAHTQIENHERQVNEREVRSTWYTFFSYKNRDVRDKETCRRTTEFAFHTQPSSRNQFLKERTEWGLIVDLSLVSAWKRLLPVSRKSIPGHLGVATTDLKPDRYLSRLLPHDLREELYRLDLDPREFSIQSFEIDVEVIEIGPGHRVSFPLHTVLKKADSKALRLKLRRKGFVVRSLL